MDQDSKDYITTFYQSGDVVLLPDFESFVNDVRKLFVDELSISTLERQLKTTPQSSTESLVDFIDRKSREVLAVLQFTIYGQQQHCYLIADGIFDPKIKREMVVYSNNHKITIHDFRQLAFAQTDASDAMLLSRQPLTIEEFIDKVFAESDQNTKQN